MYRFGLASVLIALGPVAWATGCPQHYAGGAAPVITNAALKPRTQELCFQAYVVMHSGLSRTPLWAAEHLVRANVDAAEALSRKDSFHPEPALPAQERAELADYARSGYDRGHMAPNGDMPTRISQAQSFSLANMVPQVHANNAGVWAGIEGAVRALALQDGELYVVSGPAFIGNEIASLRQRVLVPTHLWKVIYRPQRQQAGAYLVTNDATRTYSALSVSELEGLVGLRLLPGVAQRVRDAGMELPVPRSQAGGQHARKKGAAQAGAQADEYGISDRARRTIERLLQQLTR